MARPERAGHGAGRGGVRAGDRPPPGDGGEQLDRPGRAQHGHRRGGRTRQPAAGAAACRRHLRRPRAGPGAPAGRALRRPDDDGERRLPAGLALLRPDHPARAAAGLAAAGRPGADRPRRRGTGDARTAAGRTGRGVGLPRGVLRASGAPRASAAGGPRRARGCGRFDPRRRAAAARAGRRGALLGRRRRGGRLRGGARRTGRGDRRRPHLDAARPPVVRRGARHRRVRLGQHAGRRGRRGGRGRDPASGLHHVVVDRLLR